MLPLVDEGDSSRDLGDWSILRRLRREGELIERSWSRILFRMWSAEVDGWEAKEEEAWGILDEGGLNEGRIAETWMLWLSFLYSSAKSSIGCISSSSSKNPY